MSTEMATHFPPTLTNRLNCDDLLLSPEFRHLHRLLDESIETDDNGDDDKKKKGNDRKEKLIDTCFLLSPVSTERQHHIKPTSRQSFLSFDLIGNPSDVALRQSSSWCDNNPLYAINNIVSTTAHLRRKILRSTTSTWDISKKMEK